jgi:hypothetical protein
MHACTYTYIGMHVHIGPVCVCVCVCVCVWRALRERGRLCAAGYYVAKQIIKLINRVAEYVNRDADIGNLLKARPLLAA